MFLEMPSQPHFQYKRSNKKEYEDDDIARDFCSKVDQILKRHSGIGVKKLNI
jgi:hypothetical protein